MREREKKQQFLENEKYAFIERYLETAQDTYSITTETSDSGLKTHGEPSELGIEDSSVTEETPRLCLRHLNAEATDELRHRIDADAVAARRICQSFGIPGHIHAPTATGAILTLFPDTPLKLLRDVFEALNLCDLVELLDKAATKPSTPRLLRSVITLDEIRILRNADSRPESLHSKAAVLIFTEDEQDSGVKGIEKFFKYLNLNSIVIILKHSGISILKSKEFERKTRRRTIRKLTNLVSEHKQKGIPETDMEVRQLTERLQIERKNLERLEKKLRDLSEATEQARTVTPMVIHEWIQCQDYFSFFAVFDFWGGDILDALVMKLAREIPNKPKFVFTRLTIGDVVPETLLVADIQFDKSTQISLPMILEKRWVTMDLVAMMDELKRSVKARRGKLIIKDTLSSLPVFMKEEES